MSYASAYAKAAKDGTHIFMISLVATGNPLPVTSAPFIDVSRGPNPQGYLGKPCQRGYQSHYTVVDMSGKGPKGYPLKEKPARNSCDELVVFEPAQALAVFLIYGNKPKQQFGNYDQLTVERREWAS